jgi:type VI secretion system secreted protein VgrG
MRPSPALASNGPAPALGLPGAASPLRVNLSGIKGLLLTSFTRHEGMSQLFRFELDLLAPKGVEVPFDRVLGQPVTVELALPDRKTRYFHGVVARINQGHRGAEHTAYQAVMVPRLWLLTQKCTCRIFQDKSVPDILSYILKEQGGIDVEGNLPGFRPRNYCVQYRETDFAFASRLLEEEGLYYYFRDTEKEHKLVLGMPPQSHPPTRSGGPGDLRRRARRRPHRLPRHEVGEGPGAATGTVRP